MLVIVTIVVGVPLVWLILRIGDHYAAKRGRGGGNSYDPLIDGSTDHHHHHGHDHGHHDAGHHGGDVGHHGGGDFGGGGHHH